MSTYKIVRFRFGGASEVVRTGLTLDEAQAHCKREDTHGEGWFDGYKEENGARSEWRKVGLLESAFMEINRV